MQIQIKFSVAIPSRLHAGEIRSGTGDCQLSEPSGARSQVCRATIESIAHIWFDTWAPLTSVEFGDAFSTAEFDVDPFHWRVTARRARMNCAFVFVAQTFVKFIVCGVCTLF